MGSPEPRSLLNGKVILRHLDFQQPPVLSGGRLSTEAGEIAQISNGEEIRFLCYLEFKSKHGQSSQRGNHMHVGRIEHLYIISGELEAHYLDVAGGDTAQATLGPGDLVTVLPGCAHAYTALSYAQGIEFSPQPYSTDNAKSVEVVADN